MRVRARCVTGAVAAGSAIGAEYWSDESILFRPAHQSSAWAGCFSRIARIALIRSHGKELAA
jgi:hypothetical protein